MEKEEAAKAAAEEKIKVESEQDDPTIKDPQEEEKEEIPLFDFSTI